MKTYLKNGAEIVLRKLHEGDAQSLFNYLNGLSGLTRGRFGPHSFDWQTVNEICSGNKNDCLCYVATENLSGKIIAYSVLKKGFLQHDAPRLSSYGLMLDENTDCTFAPSVADEWQSAGLGSKMMEYIMEDVRQQGFKRIILWGGVQQSNEKAVNYYMKFGFQLLGYFEYNGMNADMVKTIV
jgi:diamine N-acetyltransferase